MNNAIADLIKDLENEFKLENENERIEVKASFIQIDILNEVKRIMKERDMTQTELAKRMKKTKSFISQLFSGDKLLNLKIIAQFEEIFSLKFSVKFIDNNFTSNSESNSYGCKFINNYLSTEKEFPLKLYNFENNKAA